MGAESPSPSTRASKIIKARPEQVYAASVRFVALEPAGRILEGVSFEATDPSLRGEMMLEVILEEAPDGTEVSFASNNLPPGLRPEDNEAGSRESLENLARRFS